MRCLLPLLAFATVFAADAPAPLRVFLRCGPKTHGPGDHDHPAFARDWQPLLNAAGMKVSIGDADAKGVQTFPSDEELARTDVLVIHRQGGGDFKPDERARVAKFAARGGSFVVIHAGAVAGNDASADFYKDLVGGSWRQKVTKWREGPMQLSFVDKAHAITKGVADFGMKDEIYYDMDLRTDIHPLATAPTPKKAGDGFEAQTQLWTYEKPGAQRAFVFIPGHTYVNFSRPDVKLLLFRGIAWAGRHANPQAFDQAASLQICVFPVPPSAEPAKK
jgi:type 1 glutamine amidotransferase